MSTMASQITSLTIVYSTVYSGTDERKHQSSASLAFVRGIHRWPVNSPHKGPATRKMFPFDDVIMDRVVRGLGCITYTSCIRIHSYHICIHINTNMFSFVLHVECPLKYPIFTRDFTQRNISHTDIVLLVPYIPTRNDKKFKQGFEGWSTFNIDCDFSGMINKSCAMYHKDGGNLQAGQVPFSIYHPVSNELGPSNWAIVLNATSHWWLCCSNDYWQYMASRSKI